MNVLRRKPVMFLILMTMGAIIGILPYQNVEVFIGFLLGVVFLFGATIFFISRFLWIWSSQYPLCPTNFRGRTRYWVETDDKLIAASIKIILCCDAGFTASIAEQAFAKEGKNVALSVLRITRMDNRNDLFIVSILTDENNKIVSKEKTFENVNDAVDEFLSIWKEWQIGEEWIDIRSKKFSLFGLNH